MDISMQVSQNPVFGNSFLNSKFFNPDYLFNRGLEFFREVFNFNVNNSADIIAVFHTLLFFLGIFFLTIISYTMVRMYEVRSKEHKHLHHEIEEYAHHQREREKKASQGGEVSRNERWTQTLSYLFSEHASDWKLAIIEADSMLETLMDQLGFKGDNLGEKLKSASQEEFRGLSSAWEVHTIRNKIAHEGLAYQVSHHEAKRIIAIYESIFRQYGFI